MADRTIGELPSLSTMEDDTLIPVEQAGVAKKMAGSVLNTHVYDLVQDDVTAISQIIAVGPQGVSPTLSSSKSGKVTTIYYTDADHTSQTVLATINDGADGPGSGDMTKAVYDTDNDGIVDNAEQLGGYGPSHYATVDSYDKVTATQTTARQIDITQNTTLASSHNGCRLRVTGAYTITIPSSLSAGFECEVLHYAAAETVVTIACASGVTMNGSSTSLTASEKYKVEVLAALTATDWMVKGDFA